MSIDFDPEDKNKKVDTPTSINLLHDRSINEISVITQEDQNTVIKQDEFVNIVTQRKRTKEKSQDNQWNKCYDRVKQVCNNHLTMRFMAAAGKIGMTIQDQVGRTMNVQNLSEIGKSWSQNPSKENMEKFAYISYINWREDPGWEIRMEKAVMEELKLVYNQDGYDNKKKPCIQRMLTSRKSEIVNNFNRRSERKNGCKCLISRSTEEISKNNKYDKRDKKTTYFRGVFDEDIKQVEKEIKDQGKNEVDKTKQDLIKNMSIELARLKGEVAEKNALKVS